jgi:cytochrome P450
MSGKTDEALGSRMASFDHVYPEIGTDGTPYDYYAKIRSEAIETGRYVGWSQKHGGFWVVMGYQECVEVARHAETFSNREATFPPYPLEEPFMIATQDDPEHSVLRAMVNRPFNPAGVKQYEPLIRENVNLLLDGVIADGKADLAKIIARPIPAMVTALLVGLPAEEGPKFSRWVRSLAERHVLDEDQANSDTSEMYDYLNATIKTRRSNPGHDVLSQVAQAEYEGRQFTDEELRGFCTLLMVGGIDNSSRLLGSMLWRLGVDKDLRSKLLREPTLIPSAVQEFLRFYSPAHIVRLVTHDTEFHGASMKKGSFVLQAYPIANRDPRMFPEPDTFDPGRTPNIHVGLGIGIHRCLGAHLVSLEARIVLEEFIKRLPEFKIDESIGAKWMTGQVGGMVSVPVTFAAGSPVGKTDGKQRRAVEAWLADAQGA